MHLPRWLVLGAIIVAGLLALAVLAPGGATGVTTGDGESPQFGSISSTSAPVYECAETPPDDFDDPAGSTADTIGWVEGYWYNQPLDIDIEDGLTESELESLSARTAARFEALRCLTIEELPPVEVITREEYAEELEEIYDEVDDEEVAFDNGVYRTLLMVSQDEDAVEVDRELQTAVVGGFYSITDGEITVITESEDALPIDEGILAHELGHAIQDQQFDLSRYDRSIHDRNIAKLGVIEGDVHLIEQEYLELCEAEAWEEPCLIDDGESASGDGDASNGVPNWGMYFMDFQPYSDGPSFIEYHYDRGGWEAVNAVYEDMPQASVETINPEIHGGFDLEPIEIADSSNESWERIELDDDEPHQRIGQAGISAMFMGQAIDAGGMGSVLDVDEVLNVGPDGTIDSSNPLNYAHSVSEGWTNDGLHVYHDDDDEIATVWKTAWSDEANASEFASAYESLLEFHGASMTEAESGVYTFDDDSSYAMAVTLIVDDDRVWIVTAPTVDDLDAVFDHEMTDGEVLPSDDDSIPGMSVAIAVFAIAASVLFLRRSHRDVIP